MTSLDIVMVFPRRVIMEIEDISIYKALSTMSDIQQVLDVFPVMRSTIIVASESMSPGCLLTRVLDGYLMMYKAS